MRNVYLPRELELDSSPEHNALRDDILKEVVIYNIANFWHSGGRSAWRCCMVSLVAILTTMAACYCGLFSVDVQRISGKHNTLLMVECGIGDIHMDEL